MLKAIDFYALFCYHNRVMSTAKVFSGKCFEKQEVNESEEMLMNINEKEKTEDFEFLYNAVLKLKTSEECDRFFKDQCTMQELISITQRLRVAKLLSEKKIYTSIVSETGASTATISRVNRTLNYGNSGYDLVFDRMSPEELK